MRKINFSKDILPHVIAIGVFLIITFFFFNPIFFDNKVLDQSDILQWEGSSKVMRDFRAQTGDEPLWSPSMFSGMPGYLVNVEWGNKVVGFLKGILSFKLPHPVCNIYLAFLCYYIMLLAFGIRSYLAIAGAIAFGLSNHMIVGLGVGHNARIGAIAFMPLVVAGVHLMFSDKKILGFGVTTAGLALHFRENHLQITYYLLLILIAYSIVQLMVFIKTNKTISFFKTISLLIPAAVIAVGTFLGPMWATLEYSTYSRGKSELVSTNESEQSGGLGRSYAFQYNYAIGEPMTLLVPNFYGGSNRNLLVQNRESKVYKALTRADEKTVNQLALYSGAYWGPSTPSPYYAGAIIVFLFAIGIAFAAKKYVWWLVPICILAIFMCWGSNFSSFNYFIFDYLPGYNKFRSVTFAIVMVLFSMPLLGLLGLEKIMTEGLTKATKKKLFIVFSIVGGICLFLLLFAGAFSFIKDGDEQIMPPWFIDALADDRKSLMRSDAFRSLAFITLVFGMLYFEIWKKIPSIVFYGSFIALMLLDIAVVDTRYFTKEAYKRKQTNTAFTLDEVDREILKDKNYYRVYNIREAPFLEARTSYFHNSIGGYHAVKLRRYQDLYDSCLFKETNELIQDASSGKLDVTKYGVINMLNAKYLVYGPGKDNVIPNAGALGNTWFVSRVVSVNSPTEELKNVCEIDTRSTAVVDASKFTVPAFKFDSTSSIKIIENKPNYLKYESQSQENGLAVFSEIYYPKGWKAFIDAQETEIIRVNYVLRALSIPKGKHTIEFKFQPPAYTVGNKITMASSWLMLVVFLGSVSWAMKEV